MGGTRKHKTVVAVFMVVLGAGLFLSFSAQAFLFAPAEDLEVQVPSDPRHEWLPPEEGPVRLAAPAIGVDAPVVHTGITRRGNMAVPSSYRDVGWYRYGTPPGGVGSAVMAGHLDNGASLPAVFNRLSELRPGDELLVYTAEGERIRFVVEDTQTYPFREVPTEKVFGRSDTARLNLVTCAGKWLSGEATYSERLVVYAVRAA